MSIMRVCCKSQRGCGRGDNPLLHIHALSSRFFFFSSFPSSSSLFKSAVILGIYRDQTSNNATFLFFFFALVTVVCVCLCLCACIISAVLISGQLSSSKLRASYCTSTALIHKQNTDTFHYL